MKSRVSSDVMVVSSPVFGQIQSIWSEVTHGWRNRSGRPGNCRTSVGCIVPKMPTDVISEVLNFKKSRTAGKAGSYVQNASVEAY